VSRAANWCQVSRDMAVMELKGSLRLFKKTREFVPIASTNLQLRPSIFVVVNGTAVAPTES
jgi:hypothetical protein